MKKVHRIILSLLYLGTISFSIFLLLYGWDYYHHSLEMRRVQEMHNSLKPGGDFGRCPNRKLKIEKSK